MIQNYNVTANLVIDVPDGKAGVPLQLWERLDNNNQRFYIDNEYDWYTWPIIRNFEENTTS